MVLIIGETKASGVNGGHNRSHHRLDRPRLHRAALLLHARRLWIRYLRSVVGMAHARQQIDGLGVRKNTSTRFFCTFFSSHTAFARFPRNRNLESVCTLSRKQGKNTRILSRKCREMLASSIRLDTLIKAQMYYVFPPLVSTGRYTVHVHVGDRTVSDLSLYS